MEKNIILCEKCGGEAISVLGAAANGVKACICDDDLPGIGTQNQSREEFATNGNSAHVDDFPSTSATGLGDNGSDQADVRLPKIPAKIIEAFTSCVIGRDSQDDSMVTSGTKAQKEDIIAVPTDRDDYLYKMDHPRRGKAIIFSHETFHKDTGLHDQPRPCSAKSALDMKATLSRLGFEVTIHTDLTVLDLRRVAETVAKEDHGDADCIVFVTMSHGLEHGIFAYNTHYDPYDMIYRHFTSEKCKTLAGKPKIFFTQACRGNERDKGTAVRPRTSTDGPSNRRKEPYKIPNEADFLTALSTVHGYVSWRRPDGAVFIRALCEKLDAHAFEMDLLTLLTLVNHEVAMHYESSLEKYKQVPNVQHTLTRLIEITRKEVP